MRPRRAAVRRAASAKAVARVQNRLLSRQAAVQSRLTRTLRQEQVEYGYSYTALFNGFSVRTARKNLEAIRNTKGVTCAFVAGSYALPTTQQADTQALQVALASSRFTGKGMTIAVLDTGLDTAHPAFANAPADAKFTKDYISGVLQAADLNAEVLMPGVTADDVYLSAKIPFAFDYAGKDAQVAPGSKWDAENLEHGTHVAGIAAGYALDGSGLVTAKAPGVTTVTATTANGASVSCVVGVSDQLTYTGLRLDFDEMTTTMYFDSTIDLPGVYLEPYGFALSGKHNIYGTDGLTWSVSDPTIADLDEYSQTTLVANKDVKTGDSGVLLYMGLMLLALTGSAWVLRKKRAR